ncbi:MAG TPA: condensation domain-containing protein, partial [Longimicrobiaceae bacterium]|nr:condensation domain-containing protein [Longimicrobiaceae bacterium]
MRPHLNGPAADPSNDSPGERRARLLERLQRTAAGVRSAPLSFAQQRLWFLEQLGTAGRAYTLPAAVRLAGPLNADALEAALAEVVRRHEALRTRFTVLDGEAVQVVVPAGGWHLDRVDLSGWPAEDRGAEARRRAEEETRREFDLKCGPLFRAVLWRLGEEEHVMELTMHHIVGDGWSLGVLFREVSALYGAFLCGAGSPLPDLPVQYADYAVWQRRLLSGERLERELAYWRECLAGAPAVLELPGDRPRPAEQSHRGAHASFEVEAGLAEELRALGAH